MILRVFSLQWFLLTIVHTYSRFRSSEVKCYVNGELVSGGDLTMAQMNEVLSSVSFLVYRLSEF